MRDFRRAARRPWSPPVRLILTARPGATPTGAGYPGTYLKKDRHRGKDDLGQTNQAAGGPSPG
jgi:hypothetical protein